MIRPRFDISLDEFRCHTALTVSGFCGMLAKSNWRLRRVSSFLQHYGGRSPSVIATRSIASRCGRRKQYHLHGRRPLDRYIFDSQPAISAGTLQQVCQRHAWSFFNAGFHHLSPLGCRLFYQRSFYQLHCQQRSVIVLSRSLDQLSIPSSPG